MNKSVGFKLIAPMILLLFVLWYQLIYVPTKQEIESFDAQRMEIETNIQIEQSKNLKMKNMLKELEELKKQDAVTEIAAYDNIQNVMNSLNGILSSADQYVLNFSVPVVDEGTGLYRRDVDLSFETSSLMRADQIIRNIYASPYRCVIGSMRMNAEDTTGNQDNRASLADDGNAINMQLTYYEMDIKK